jgi:hypothetical protein
VPGASELDSAAAWVYAVLQVLFAYDDLLANEWDERVLPRTLDMVLEARAAKQISTAGTPEDARRLADAAAQLARMHGVDRLASGWANIRPYRLPGETPLSDYAAHRRAQFRAYLEAALRALPPDLRADLDTRFAARRAAELPAYQRHRCRCS